MDKKRWVAAKRFGKYSIGDEVPISPHVARAYTALGFVVEAPPMAPAALLAPKREYKRRDMVPAVTAAPVAEAPAPVEPPAAPPRAWRKPKPEGEE